MRLRIASREDLDGVIWPRPNRNAFGKISHVGLDWLAGRLLSCWIARIKDAGAGPMLNTHAIRRKVRNEVGLLDPTVTL